MIVKKGVESKEVELVGGTVQSAIDQSGFTISSDEEIDHDAEEYLTDGMVIRITKETKVTLIADGKSQNIKTRSVTIEELLDEQQITLGEDDEISEDKDMQLKDEMQIIIKRVEYKEEVKTEAIKYETETKSDDSMYIGETKTIQEGKNGEKNVAYKVKYVDGKEDSKEKISETITVEPVNEIIAKGSKANYDQYLGVWTDKETETAYKATGINFIEISGNSVYFELYTGNTYQIINAKVAGEIIDGKIDFNFTDSWNGKGHGTVTLSDNSVHLYCVQDQRGNLARYTLDCDVTLTR